jgi:hypothetical protein
LALGAPLLVGCVGPGEQGQCTTDEECAGARGQICNVEAAVCEDEVYDGTTAETPAGANFSDKIISFFRGTVCAPTQVLSGATFPVEVTPCVHPCITVSLYKFKHFYECTGSLCDAYAVPWYVVDGANCPADAFSRFAGACSPDAPTVQLNVNTTLDSGPLVGSMYFEVPFLTNADIAPLVGADGTGDPATGALKSAIFQYPRSNNRMLNGGMPLDIGPSQPAPPADCSAGGCTCFEIGG